MIKILHIITGLGTGGAETMLLKLLSGLDRSRFQPVVISLTRLEGVDVDIRSLQIEVISLNMIKGISLFKTFFLLVKHIKQIKPDIVQTWMYHADLLGGLAAKCARIPRIIWGIRHSSVDLTKDKISTRLVIKSCGSLSKIIPTKITCNSRTSCESHALLGYDRSKMYVIPNGFDTELFFPDQSARQRFRDEIDVSDSTCLIGLIARYTPIKGHKVFIEAAGQVYKKLNNVHFILCGENITIENPDLMSMIKREGIEEATSLLGIRSDMPSIHSGIDILVSASYGEGFSNVIGEAMSCETPCVVTDVGDSAFIVGDAGIVVPPGDEKALSEALLKILKLNEADLDYMRRGARTRILKCFGLSAIVGKYQTIYDYMT